jgi:predicted phage terminase large subunit-like protein
MSKLESIYLAAVRNDFKVFVQHAFASLYPGQPFDDNWHIDAIVDRLERAGRGELRRLIINMPPRHLKSFIVTVAWPAFLLGHDPTVQVVCVSHTDDLAAAHARDCKRILESQWYRCLFPKTRLTKNAANEAVTDQGGCRYAVPVGGSVTGRGGDVIIIDDPIKPEDAHSDALREKVNQWYGTTLLSRLTNKAYGVMVVVMQRVHVNDLSGYLYASGGFHQLKLPAIAMRDEVIETRHGRRHLRREGEALLPLREDVPLLNQMRKDIGTFTFAAQYQQSPQTPEGGLIKRKWFTLTDKRPLRSRTDRLILSIDTAQSTSETADYTAMTVLHADHGRYCVQQATRGRLEYEEIKAKVERYIGRVTQEGRQLTVLVEAAGVGHSLLQYLRAWQLRGSIQLQPYRPRTSKMARASYILPALERGVSVLNREGYNTWVEPFLNELTTFPYGRHDDWVDSLIYALDHAERRYGRDQGIGFMLVD